MGCVHCEAAGSITSGHPLTDEQDRLVAEMIAARAGTLNGDAALIAAVMDAWLDDLAAMLHDACPSGRRCWCQHGQPWEQGDGPDTPAYIDMLPAQDPRRIAYEQTTGRKITT